MASQPRITCIDCRSRLAEPGAAWCKQCQPSNPPLITGNASTAPERYGLAALCAIWLGASVVLWRTATGPFGWALSGAMFACAGFAFNVSARAWIEHRRLRP